MGVTKSLASASDLDLLDAEEKLVTMFKSAAELGQPADDLVAAHTKLTETMAKRGLIYEDLPDVYFCKDYSREDRENYAQTGEAMEDGSFPILNEADLHRGISVVHQHPDPAKAMSHIINRAKAMGMDNRLPAQWNDPNAGKPQPPTPGAYSMDAPKAPSTTGVSPAKKSFGSRVAEALTKAMQSVVGPETWDAPDMDLVDDIEFAMVKADDAQRYTLGPVYIPGQYDAHDEWATADDLEKSCWDYVRKSAGDRTIYLQHSPKPAGEWVGILAWPQEVTTVMHKSVDGVTKAEKVTFPAGTPYMGVVWEPWAWEDVKKGKITGFSIGGHSKRVEASIK